MNDTFFYDSWFRVVKKAEDANIEGVGYCGTLKTSNKIFCLATLKIIMNGWLGGSHHIVKSDTIVPGDKPLMDIRYKYISQKILGFIDMERGLIT